jgi:hypothetical protein
MTHSKILLVSEIDVDDRLARSKILPTKCRMEGSTTSWNLV